MATQIEIVGLGVMGQNLALNMERNGYTVAGYDLDSVKTCAFIEGPATVKISSGLIAIWVKETLEKPRQILMF